MKREWEEEKKKVRKEKGERVMFEASLLSLSLFLSLR